MLKMFQTGAKSGDTAAFWEENWEEDRFEEGVRFCAIDPLRPFFERYAPPGSRVLEGGCGQGHYVAFLAERELRVVGLDFARATLQLLHVRRPDLRLCVGNVARLPFRSGSFDVYYSGGVVEHFEDGPEPALREAHRVLRPGGFLLVSVPYLSPVRQALTPFRKGLWERVAGPGVESVGSNQGRRFWQYAFTPREFTERLQAAGFSLVEQQGYSILWGLYDLPGVAEAVAAAERVRARRGKRAAVPGNGEPSRAALPDRPGERIERPAPMPPISVLKRLVVSEDAEVPVGGLAVRALRWLCANMMMFACRR